MTASTQLDTKRLPTTGGGIAEAAKLLGRGELVAFPTETVYGLGADGRSGAAVAALYAAKGRPAFNPLIAHLPDAEAARWEGAFDDHARRLAAAFWPGPLTLVVPRHARGGVCDLARAGLDTVGLRVPSSEVAQRLLVACGFPVVAPSANRSGRISPTRAEDVLEDLDGRIGAVMMGAATAIGVESTILACLGGVPRLLRPGGITREAIEAVLSRPLDDGDAIEGKPLAPGALASHYAPRSMVRLNALRVEPGEALLSFGSVSPPGAERAAAVLDLSPRADLAEAATNLFASLRALDATDASTIAVVPIPEAGFGEAINDRLRRAAAER